MPARLVLDTNALLDLWLFDDPRCAFLRDGLAAGTLCVVSSAACREEFMRVLHYPALALDDARRGEMRARFDATCELLDVAPSEARLPRCRDADDQKFLELARDAGARALVTRDAELLKLSRRARGAAGFDIATPEALPSVLRAEPR